MSKRLTINRFARVFLDEWNEFKYEIVEKPIDCNGEIRFNWKFKKYSGNGRIDIKNGELCNCFGDNYSNMSVLDPSNLNIKTNDALYNDPELSIVFKKIILGQ